MMVSLLGTTTECHFFSHFLKPHTQKKNRCFIGDNDWAFGLFYSEIIAITVVGIFLALMIVYRVAQSTLASKVLMRLFFFSNFFSFIFKSRDIFKENEPNFQEKLIVSCFSSSVCCMFMPSSTASISIELQTQTPGK